MKAHKWHWILRVAVLLANSSLAAQTAQRQTLHGHVPGATAHLAPVERTDSAKHLHLAIGLPLRNQEALAKLLHDLYDPTSPGYRQYLTPAQFTEQFGPTAQDYEAVVGFAKASGFTVTARHPNRLIVDVEGSIATIEKALHVTMRNYQHPKEARKFYAPDTEPSLDLAVPVLHISGLDNYSIPHPNLKVRPAGLTANATPSAGSGPGGAYAGGDFRAAYVPGTTLTGAGQSVGLLQFDGYYASDIAAYKTQFGLPDVPLVNVAVDGGVSTPGSGNSEVCLDIEMVLSMSPGVSAIYVYEAPNPSPWVDLLSRMANDNLSKQLSCSWGGGSPDATAEAIFQQMAAQGQSFYNATGDSDAFTGSIEFPSDSPNITEVGATTLTTSGAGGSYLSETVWNWGGGTGSSGGTSTYYSIPSWQQGVSMATNQGSTTMRNVPDVALTGDNVYVKYNNGSSGAFGGTSCAAPLWAGFTALMNQRAVENGRTTVGFVNPAIYTIGKGASYTTNFHDTTTGNNFSTSSPTQFSAVAGFDLCTGWGTPAGSALIDALAGPADSLQVSLSSFVSNGAPGGPFTPDSNSYTLVNTGSTSLTWSASATQGWLDLSATSGTLVAGGTATVTATINSNANSLVSGSYGDTITFTNITTSVDQTRPVSLDIAVPAPVMGVTPATALVATGDAGGPFSPSSATYSVANTGNAPLDWLVSNTTSWLSVSQSGGTLAVGGSTTVTATINSNANSLTSGSYSDTVSFTNTTNGTGNTTRAVTLAVALDYFTQLFASGNNNTANQSFTFTPNGSVNYYQANRDVVTSFPSDPSGGTTLSLTDDSYSTVTLTGTAKARLYGTSYATFYVGSNGYITFGSGDTTYSPSLAAHFSKPRISALFRDLNPGVSGTISWRQFTDRAVVTWQGVPAYYSTGSNNFQVEMFFDGRIRITILGITATDGLIGLSQGLGQPTGFTSSVFGTYPPTPGPAMNVTPTGGLTSSGTYGGPFTLSSLSYTVSNTGTTSMNWTALKTASWITLSATAGTLASGTSTTVMTTINTTANTLATGTYGNTTTFTNTTNGVGNAFRTALLTITGTGKMGVSATNLVSSGVAGGPFSPSGAAIIVSNTGSAPMSWTATKTQTWLTLSATSGSLQPGTSGTVTASINSNANSLAAGVYSGTMTFTNATNGIGNATRTASLTVIAQNPALGVSSAGGLSATGATGGPFSPSGATFTLSNTGNATMSWTAGKAQTWLTLSATNGSLASGSSTTVTATINANANSLAPGTFSDTISFANASNGNGNTTRAVALTVQTPYAAWQQMMFTTAQLADPSVSGDNAAPAGDGIPNLMKYALGLTPLRQETSGIAVQNDGATLTISYPRRSAAVDVTLHAYWTSNLGDPNSWSTTGVTETMLSDDGTLQLWQAAVPVGSSQQKFIRLKVTRP